MKIECRIRREGPTRVTVAGFDYIFKQDEGGRKVCDVLSSSHQKYFLALPDYVECRAEEPELVECADEVPAEEPPLIGKRDGSPFASEASAQRAAKTEHELERFRVVEVEGGFAIEVPL